MKARVALSLISVAVAGGVAEAAPAAAPVEGYHSADGRVGCVMYQAFNSDGNAVKCGRRGSSRGLLLPSAGPARRARWRWPARQLGSLFFTAPWNRTLYLYGGTAKLEGDASLLRCTFRRHPTSVRCLNGDGYGLKVTRTSVRATTPN